MSRLETEAGTVASKLRCLMLPKAKCNRIFGRTPIFEQLDHLLGLEGSRTTFRSVALHGLGGVGKSTIASRFAEKRYNEKIYDVVLWIQSETLASLRQSFTDVAMRLKLPSAQPQTHDDNLISVQDWLQSTGMYTFIRLRYCP